jgi:hypothetical protein
MYVKDEVLLVIRSWSDHDLDHESPIVDGYLVICSWSWIKITNTSRSGFVILAVSWSWSRSDHYHCLRNPNFPTRLAHRKKLVMEKVSGYPWWPCSWNQKKKIRQTPPKKVLRTESKKWHFVINLVISWSGSRRQVFVTSEFWVTLVPDLCCVYYETIKRESKRRPIFESRCDERLKAKPHSSQTLGYTGDWNTQSMLFLMNR